MLKTLGTQNIFSDDTCDRLRTIWFLIFVEYLIQRCQGEMIGLQLMLGNKLLRD